MTDRLEGLSELVDEILHLNDEKADVQIAVTDTIVRAHKAILMKCPYYEAIFKGDWVESHTLALSLPGFSARTAEFAFAHLYTEHTVIPSEIDLVELAALTDMLGIETLLQLVSSTLTSRFCHNFHKPCLECTESVPQCLQVATLHNLTSLSCRCLDWLAKHFVKTWRTRQYALLKTDTRERCAQLIKDSLTTSNVIDVGLDCQQLVKTLPRVKWSESVRVEVSALDEACREFTRSNFSRILSSQKFQSIRTRSAWDLELIEAFLIECVPNTDENQCCLSFNQLHKMKTSNADDLESTFAAFLDRLLSSLEKQLVQRVAKATKCAAWDQLPQSHRDRIMQQGFFSPMNVPSAKKPSQGRTLAPRPVRPQSGRNPGSTSAPTRRAPRNPPRT